MTVLRRVAHSYSFFELELSSLKSILRRDVRSCTCSPSEPPSRYAQSAKQDAQGEALMSVSLSRHRSLEPRLSQF